MVGQWKYSVIVRCNSGKFCERKSVATEDTVATEETGATSDTVATEDTGATADTGAAGTGAKVEKCGKLGQISAIRRTTATIGTGISVNTTSDDSAR